MDDNIQLATELFNIANGSEVEQKMAEQVGAGILDDLIARSKVARKQHGPGFFVFVIDQNETIWECPITLKHKITDAGRRGDFTMAHFFQKLDEAFSNLEEGKTLMVVSDIRKNVRRNHPIILDNDNPSGVLPKVLDLACSAARHKSGNAAN